jgi:hypothetical protein
MHTYVTDKPTVSNYDNISPGPFCPFYRRFMRDKRSSDIRFVSITFSSQRLSLVLPGESRDRISKQTTGNF